MGSRKDPTLHVSMPRASPSVPGSPVDEETHRPHHKMPQAGACEKQPTKSSEVNLPLRFGRRGAEPVELLGLDTVRTPRHERAMFPATLLLPRTLYLLESSMKELRIWEDTWQRTRGGWCRRATPVSSVVGTALHRHGNPDQGLWQRTPHAELAHHHTRKRKGNPDSNRSADGVAQGFAQLTVKIVNGAFQRSPNFPRSLLQGGEKNIDEALLFRSDTRASRVTSEIT